MTDFFLISYFRQSPFLLFCRQKLPTTVSERCKFSFNPPFLDIQLAKNTISSYRTGFISLRNRLFHHPKQAFLALKIAFITTQKKLPRKIEEALMTY